MAFVRTFGVSVLVGLSIALSPVSSYASGGAQGDRLDSFSALIGAPPVIREEFAPSNWSNASVDDYGRADRFVNDSWHQWQDGFGGEHRPHGGGWEFGGAWGGGGFWDDHHHFPSAVPEPGVTAMSLAALGAVVFLARRRGRR